MGHSYNGVCRRAAGRFLFIRALLVLCVDVGDVGKSAFKCPLYVSFVSVRKMRY